MARYVITETSVQDGILHFRLRPRRGRVFYFEPGQYASLSFAVNGRPTPSRCFSIVSQPGDSELEFGIRVLGDFTQTVAGLEIGAAATVHGPFGEFSLYRHNTRPVIMLAAGIGITPFMSMLRSMKDLAPSFPVTLVYSVRTLADAPFRDEIYELSSQIPNLRVVYFVSAAKGQFIGQRNVIAGRLTEAYVRRIVRNQFGESLYYLCGPSKFMKTYQKFLTRQGAFAEQIFSESFTQAAKLSSGRSISRLSFGLTTAAMMLVSASIMTVDLVGHTSLASGTGTTQAAPVTQLAPVTQAAPLSSTTTSSNATPTQTTIPTPAAAPSTQTYQAPVSSVS